MTLRKSFRDKMLRRLFNAVVSLFATGSVVAQSDSLNVLFIGNSYTHMNDMPGIFDKICKSEGLSVNVQKSAQSGASFKVHSEREDMYEAIASNQWDYVVLQGFSRELSWNTEHIDSETVPYVDKIMGAIKKNNPNTNILFYMTWGYENGFQEREEVNTYEKMADSIEKGYSYLGQKYDLPVVPVGMVWKEVKGDTTASIDLYAPDRAHPSKNGSFLIANTFFEAIFGLRKQPELGIIPGEYERVIRNAVNNYVSGNRDRYKLNRDMVKIEVEVEADTLKDEDRYRLDYSMENPSAKSVLWDFDGEKRTNWAGMVYLNRSLTEIKVQSELTFEDGSKRVYERFLKLNAVDNRRRRREGLVEES